MNTQDKPKSLQDIVKQRQQSHFVGREDQINRFSHNLALPLEDNRRCFLFNVSGQGGVGKTTLLRQFRKIADEAKMISAYIDEAEKTIPEVMDRLAQELEQQGYKLTQFSDSLQSLLPKVPRIRNRSRSSSRLLCFCRENYGKNWCASGASSSSWRCCI